MGLPFETPGGYEDDNTTPDAGRYTDDLTPGDYDSHGQEGGSHGAAGEDNFFEDDFDYEDDEPEEGDRAGWDPSSGLMGGSDRM